MVQGILAARLLGPAGYGLVAIVMGYASTVNGLLSFRMSELVVRYGGEYLERGERDRAAALVKAASLTEGLVSVFAFLVVVLSAGLATRYFAKTPGTEMLFIVYALGLLANFNIETSTGILQVTDKIRSARCHQFIPNHHNSGDHHCRIFYARQFADRAGRIFAWQSHFRAGDVHHRAGAFASRDPAGIGGRHLSSPCQSSKKWQSLQSVPT